MKGLETRYLGLELKHPLMVSSCGLTGSLAGIMECARHGASAVVLQSLFEEQIDLETGIFQEAGVAMHPEAMDYLNELGKTRGPERYLQLISEAKVAVDIPVIASIHCMSDRWWMDFARQVETAGADALELNIASIPGYTDGGEESPEARVLRVVREVKSRLSIPVTVKIGPWFSVLSTLVASIRDAGADGLVLFNRFYPLDIDAENQAFIRGPMFSSPSELHLPLRWTAILAPQAGIPIAASTGVHSGQDVIKMILAGAQVVQAASVLYLKGTGHLQTMVAEMAQWLERHGVESLDAVRGSMSSRHEQARGYLGRLQYIKALSG